MIGSLLCELKSLNESYQVLILKTYLQKSYKQVKSESKFFESVFSIQSEHIHVSYSFPKYMAGYLALLNGHQQHNIRARLSENGLTVEEQVQCLIDMATDPALLGIQFHGFQPWI